MKKLFTLLPVMLLAACVGQPLPPVTEYSLSPSMPAGRMMETSLPLTLRLGPVVASRIYQGSELYYLDGAYRLNPYAYSRWVDAPVRMLQLVLQDGLERSGLFQAVLPSSSRLQADLRLEVTLYDFSHHLQGKQGSEAVVRMGVHLLDARQGRLLASRRFEARMPAPGGNASAAVAAINGAVADILPRLLDWLQGSLKNPS
ncbi:ABC-type transport auxiliary lipoprotein family protein [Thiolapillus sp.]